MCPFVCDVCIVCMESVAGLYLQMMINCMPPQSDFCDERIIYRLCSMQARSHYVALFLPVFVCTMPVLCDLVLLRTLCAGCKLHEDTMDSPSR
jgi:hypothetical protein